MYYVSVTKNRTVGVVLNIDTEVTLMSFLHRLNPGL